MAVNNDIILDDGGDLIELNGEFFTGDNDNNLMFYNVISNIGHWRTSPLIGGEIETYLNGNTPFTVIERNLKSSLARDIFENADVNARNFPEVIINKTIIISTDGN